MNNVVLLGRLTKDPEIRYVGTSQTAVATFNLAVERSYRSKNGDREVDFVPVEMWDRKAELCGQYLKKGSLISIDGQLRIENYQVENGENRRIFKVRADNFNFINIGKKQDNNKSNSKYYEGKKLFEENGVSVEILESEIPF